MEENKNNPSYVENSILSENKIPGCDQLTRPEEIKALSKYLGNIRKVQEKHTTLQKNNLEIPGRTTGRIPKVELPDFVDPIADSTNKNKAKIYGESSRVPLEKNHEPAELNNSMIGLTDDRKVKLEKEKYKLSDIKDAEISNYKDLLKKKPGNIKLEDKKEELTDNRETSLGGYKETLKDSRETTLSGHLESLKDDRNISLGEYIEPLEDSRDVSLGDYIDSLTDDRETSLGEYRDPLNDTREVNLGDHKETITDNRKLEELPEEKDRLKNIEPTESLGGYREPLIGTEGLESYTIVRAPSGEEENLTELPDTVEKLKNIEETTDLPEYKDPLYVNDETSLEDHKETLNYGKNLEGPEELGDYKETIIDQRETVLPGEKESLDYGENLGGVEEVEDHKEPLDFGDRLGDEDNFVEDHQEKLDFGENLGDDETLRNYRENLDFGERLGDEDNFVEDHQEKLDFGDRLGDSDNFVEDHQEKLDFGERLGDSDNFVEDHQEKLDFGERLGDEDNFVEDHQEKLDFGERLGDSDNFVEDHKEPLDFGDRLGDSDNFVEDHKEKLDFGERLGDEDNFIEDHKEPLDFGERLGDSDNFVEDHQEKLDFGDRLGDYDNFVEDHQEKLDFGERLGDSDNFVEDHQEKLDFGDRLGDSDETLEDYIDKLEDDRDDINLEDYIDKLEDDRKLELSDVKKDLPEYLEGSRSEDNTNFFNLELSNPGELYTDVVQRPDADPNAPRGENKYNFFDLESLDSNSSLYTEVVQRPDVSQDAKRQDDKYTYLSPEYLEGIEAIQEISKYTGDEMYNKAMEFMKESEASEWEKKIQSLVSSYLSGSKITPDKALEFEIKAGNELKVFLKTINSQVGDDEDNDSDKNESAFLATFGTTKRKTEAINRTGTEDIPENISTEGQLHNEYDDASSSLRGSSKDLPPMKLPDFNIDSLNINNYLRYVTEKTVGQIKNNGIREVLIQETLAGLVWARDELERVSKSNRDRLPGGDMGIVSDLVSGGVSGVLDNLGSRIGDTVTSLFGDSDSVNMNNPVNRPDGKDTTGWTYPETLRISQSQSAYSNTLSGDSPIYDLHKKISGVVESENKNFWGKLGDALSSSFLGKDTSKKDYTLDQNYLRGGGIKTTLEELCGVNPYSISSVEDLKKALNESPFISTPNKYMSSPDWPYRVQTLDSDAYWEVILTPFCGDENGNLSYLPGIHEINVRNIAQHGVNTGYNQWIPYVGFDLQKSKMTSKTLQLYDGEISYPISMEYLNEFRLTIADDQYKSWRTYFEECAKAAIYNSEGHNLSYYEDGLRGTTSLTAIDTSNVVIAMYKNISFRCKIFVMTPQFSTIHRYDLLLVMKDFTEEHSGEIDGGASDLTVSFSVVGELNGESAKKNEIKINYLTTPDKEEKSSNSTGNLVGSIVEHGVDTAVGLLF